MASMLLVMMVISIFVGRVFGLPDSMFPFSVDRFFSFHLIFPFPMFFAVFVAASVDVSVSEFKGALAVLLVIFPLAVIATLVRILQYTMSVLGIIAEFASVHVSRGVAIHAFAVLLVVAPQARVHITAAVVVRPRALFFAFFEFSIVVHPAGEGVDSMAVHLIKHEMAHIYGPASETVHPLALFQSVAPFTAVHISAGEAILPLAVILSLAVGLSFVSFLLFLYIRF
mmetsp:Transcript_1399/g.1907  ORF Transcript_1399/g.1907 Transcript_1399/m.1907 type:complete len:227 (-) Transcript_1399:1056-1736(-)